MADNEGGTFGRSLMNYVQDRLPYSQPMSVLDNIQALNPKYKDFYKVGTNKEELISKHSVSTHKQPGADIPAAGVALDKNYHAFMYANVDYDKSKRLRDYRVMAQFAEVADALDEICDDAVNRDSEDDIVTIQWKKEEIDLHIKSQVNEEFDKFIKHYELETRGWEYFRQVLVDGEIFFEHIIHKEHKKAGILGILQIPSELVDPIYDNIQNLLIKGFLLRRPKLEKQGDPRQAAMAPLQTDKIEHIPFEKSQITYIHSGAWNETKALRMPFIENGRRAYRQLSLIEDAIIIYRLVRAPERLVFNVDVGNMPPPKAEAYLKKLMQNYWGRKTYDNAQGASVQAFNPQSMLDSFWFAKRAGSEGTDVKTLAGGQNLGQLDDLKYFKSKLYRALKVPVARLDPEAQADPQGATILREELKFAKFIIRLQQRFAVGLKEAFITHLNLRELWDDYELKEGSFDIEFNPPSSWHELRNQQVHELKWNNYSGAIGSPLIADTWAKKHMLKFTDEEIIANREMLRKDAALKWELAQIEAMGPNWREAFEAQQDAAEGGAPPMGGDMGGAMPMGGGMPPDFGGMPPEGGAPGDMGGAMPAPEPVGGDTALPQ
ncbi:hypothetical protein CL634_00850 [bacterium]|nr:hypothetical protein [bacterium]